MLRRAFSLLRWKTPHHASSKCGQAVMLLLALILAMAAMAFWVIDTHHAVLARLRAQDAGDPVALAAAKWQAAGLNLIGELNLIRAFMLADDVDNLAAASALYELQQRISLVTPLLSLQAAQHTARLNRATPLPEAKDFLRKCAQMVEFPNFYPGATEDFNNALETLLRQEEIYAFPISAIYSDASTLLSNQDFYEAILGGDYCWFWFNAYQMLESYRSHRDFGPVPEISTEIFFSLDLQGHSYSLNELYRAHYRDGEMETIAQQMNELLHELDHPLLPDNPPTDEPFQIIEAHTLLPWMAYGAAWKPWEQMHQAYLPLRADVRDEYDVLGAFTAISIERNHYPWLTVAKPFGSVGGEPPRTNELILGGFDAVRLVPVDSTDATLRAFNPEWLRHLYHHIREYSQSGRTFGGCRYCNALVKWDNPAYRTTVSTWLSLHGHTCRRPKPGRGPSGGSHYAH